MSEAAGNLSPDALIAAAATKAGLVWVGVPGARPLPVWHVWDGDALGLVVGGQEQPDPVPDGATRVEVQVPSKDHRGRLLTFGATVEQVWPDDERWDALTTALKADRLNAEDADTMVERWAATSRVLRLLPDSALDEGPGHYDDSSGAAPPPPTPATTATWRPFHAGGRKRPRHRLR